MSELVEKLMDMGLTQDNIGVIAPYMSQIALLR